MTIDTLAGMIKQEFDVVGGRFDKVEADIKQIKGDITGIKGEVAGLKDEVKGIKGEVGTIKATMVTKNYLDDKLADLRGDLVVMMRKEDSKVAN